MASVDLQGGDAQRIRSTYQSALQRDASDDEVSGWLSGSYGGGGVNDWVNQISSSDEARQRGTYKPPTVTPPGGTTVGVQNPGESGTGNQTPYQNTDWWSQQGVGTDQMFDANGQMKPGWQRTGKGYERTTTGTGWDADPKGNFSSWFLNNVSSMAPSGKALESLAPYLSKFGIKLGARNASGMIDTIVTPDGKAWDVIESATMDGGKRWQWIPAGGASGSGTGGQGLGGQLPGTQYSDPYSKFLEQILQSRIAQLQQPLNDPNRAAYEAALKNRAGALGEAEPAYQQLLGFLQQRFQDLKGPGYTGAENETIRTGALDPIESDRTAAKKRMTDQLAARGINPQSGVFQEAMLKIDNAFDAIRGTTQTTLTTTDLARREDRAQRAEGLGAQLVDIPQMRSREQLDVFQALELLSAAARGEDESRAREAISYSGALADLGPQRMQLAMQAAGMGGSPESMLNGLLGVANLNNSAAAINRSNSGSLWSGLGSIAAILARSGR